MSQGGHGRCFIEVLAFILYDKYIIIENKTIPARTRRVETHARYIGDERKPLLRCLQQQKRRYFRQYEEH